jgi:hypothetical protein
VPITIIAKPPIPTMTDAFLELAYHSTYQKPRTITLEQEGSSFSLNDAKPTWVKE